MNKRILLKLLYLLQPVAFGSWLPRIPDVKLALELGAAELAVSLMGLPVGIVLVLPIATLLLGKIGNRATITIGFLVMLFFMPLVVGSVSQTMLFLTLCAVGATNTLLLLALNVDAARIERVEHISILNTCHGFGSVGLMLGSFFGSLLASLSLAPVWAVGLMVTAILPLVLALIHLLPAATTNHKDDTPAQNRVSVIPSWPLLSICLFAFGIAMTEGAIADWSAVYLVDRFSADGGAAGVGFTVFAAAVALGRFMGDAIKTRLGTVATARLFGVFALAGFTLVIGSSTMHWVFIGFAVLGFGVSVGYPLAVSSASVLTGSGLRPERNVATLTFVALLGFLAGPLLIGFIAEFWGIRIGLVVLLPMLVMSLVLATGLGRNSLPKSQQL